MYGVKVRAKQTNEKREKIIKWGFDMKKNKYDKKFYDMEKKIDFNSKYIEVKAMINLYKTLKKTGNLHLIEKYSLRFEHYILTLSTFSNDFQEMLIKNVISLFNKEYLIMFFIRSLTVELTLGNLDLINIYMKSFIDTKLIKDIKFNKKAYIVTLLDGKTIKFSQLLENKKQIEETVGQCHNFCHLLMKTQAKDRDDVYSVTILEKDFCNRERYHTFLLVDGYIRDFSRNIVMKFEDYKKIYSFKILLFISSKQLFKNLEIKEKKSVEFKESTKCDILKYAIDKQLKKEAKNIQGAYYE